MARGAQALLNQVYPTDLHGDTVVLKPRGDAAGFTLHAVSTEMAHVRDLIESGKVRNLLIDLGDHRYFGSMVIGDLIDLAQLVRSRGGRTGLCGVSDDMSSVLRLMQLDDHWEHFSRRSVGLHALAKIPAHHRVWSLRYPIAAVAAAVVLFAVYWFYPRPNYAVEYHAKLDKLWHDVSVKRTQVGLEEWRWIAKKTEMQLTPVIAQLERKVTSHRANAAEKYLLIATKYHWLPWLDETGFDEDRDRQMTQYFLDMTYAASTGKPTPPEPLVAAVSVPAVTLPPEFTGETGAPSSSAAILPSSETTEQPESVSPSDPEGSQSTDSSSRPI